MENHIEKLSKFYESFKIHSFLKVFFSVYENKVLQMMLGGASLERFGEKDIVFIR